MMSSIASRGSESAAAMVSTPTGPPPKLSAIGVEIAAVHLVEPDRIDIEQPQRLVGEPARHLARALDDREIAHPSQKAARDARRAARAPRDLVGAFFREREADDARAARDDALQFFGACRN